MKNQRSLREVFLMRSDARVELLNFLDVVENWPGEEKDFLDSRAHRTPAIKTALEARTAKPRFAVRGITVDGTQVLGQPPQLAKEFKGHYFGLLRGSLNREVPTGEQISALATGLGGAIESFQYYSKANPPFYVKAAPLRMAAESLLRYLNLIATCGPVHGICEGCATMFIRNKGVRKFCSQCGEKRNTYEARKEYLREKRMEHYWKGRKPSSKKKGKIKRGKSKKH